MEFYYKTVSKISEDTRIDDGKLFTHSIIGKKLNTLINEMKGSPLRQCAKAISQILFESIPKNLDAERREHWLIAVETIQNLALDIDKAEEFIQTIIDKKQAIQKNDGDAITITTLHSAKGLEWKNVFMIGCEETVIPHFKNKNLEEERRLFMLDLHEQNINYSQHMPTNDMIKQKNHLGFYMSQKQVRRRNWGNLVG